MGKNIKLADNVINPLPDDFYGDIVNITDKDLQKLCNEILVNKIDVT